ncbi:ABC transporter ATP-binding protein [Myceligenerans indicum]|uniref:ABC transporter ATP-binding protein n=1 Tax=Myceligenerans indicum TaxID=2593663 RepID=A0ABS1LNC6_9MICO|nr:ABC transporter ATP-binding protein [Myceligenerans indicum]MBL0887678.1 ABC transporter ATP-binding protein [Myceligenerans indicum]
MSAVALKLTGVTRVHGKGAGEVHALRGVDLEVRRGEMVAVMGPSGSGKSTLLHLAGGLDTATSGRVEVAGRDVGSAGARERAALRRKHIGYVFQDFNLVPALTARENVMVPLELDGMPARRAREHARVALAEVGMEDMGARFPDDMSGGQAQRVAIARALVGTRGLLLADEPTGALDSVTGEAVLRVLRARVEAGAAGVLVTHDARHAAWADRTVFLRDGLLVDGTTAAPSAESLLAGAAATGGHAADDPDDGVAGAGR